MRPAINKKQESERQPVNECGRNAVGMHRECISNGIQIAGQMKIETNAESLSVLTAIGPGSFRD